MAEDKTVASLIELLKESPRVLFQVLREVRQAGDLICPELEELLQPQGRGIDG